MDGQTNGQKKRDIKAKQTMVDKKIYKEIKRLSNNNPLQTRGELV